MTTEEARVQMIEMLLSKLQTQFDNLVLKSDVITAVNIRQEEIENLTLELNSLKTQVELLQSMKLTEEILSGT